MYVYVYVFGHSFIYVYRYIRIHIYIYICVCVWIVVHTQKHMLERHMAELSTQLQHAFEPIFSNCKKLETFALRNFGFFFLLYIYIYIIITSRHVKMNRQCEGKKNNQITTLENHFVILDHGLFIFMVIFFLTVEFCSGPFRTCVSF